jgi:type I restriction enzyme S subunit
VANSYYEKFANGAIKCIDAEIPFNIPQTWEWTRLGVVIQLKSGQDFPPEKYSANPGGTLYLTGASNIDGERIVENRWTDTPSVIAPFGSLLLVCKGSGVGKMCFMNLPKAHIARQLQAIIPMSQDVDSRFVRIALECRLHEITQQANGVIPGIAREAVLTFLLPVPPFKEQERILDKVLLLSSLSKRFGEQQHALTTLNHGIIERLRKSILQEAIQGKLVSQDPNDEPAIALLERIRAEKQKLLKEGKLKKKDVIESVIFKGDDNKYYENVNGKMLDISEEVPFDIPDTWCWCRVGDIVNILDSYRKPVSKGDRESGKYPYYGANGILDYVNSYLFDGDYILIGEDGSVLTKGGNPVVNRARGKIWVNNHAHIMASYIGSSFLDYLYYALQGISIKKLVHGFMPKYSQGDLRITLIPVPPAKEQARILERLNNVLASTMRT